MKQDNEANTVLLRQEIKAIDNIDDLNFRPIGYNPRLYLFPPIVEIIAFLVLNVLGFDHRLSALVLNHNGVS